MPATAYPTLTVELRDRMIAKVAETVKICCVFEVNGNLGASGTASARRVPNDQHVAEHSDWLL